MGQSHSLLEILLAGTSTGSDTLNIENWQNAPWNPTQNAGPAANMTIVSKFSFTFAYLLHIGDYVLVTPIEEGDKVRAEIISILYKEQIKYIKEEGKW